MQADGAPKVDLGQLFRVTHPEAPLASLQRDMTRPIPVDARGGATVRPRYVLPFLISASILLNLCGYVFRWFYTVELYDEVTHVVTTCAGVLAVAALRISGTRRLAWPRTRVIVLAALGVGVGLGLAWEFFELAIGIIGGLNDTLLDLAMDLIGAAAAGIWIARSAAASAVDPGQISERAEQLRFGCCDGSPLASCGCRSQRGERR